MIALRWLLPVLTAAFLLTASVPMATMASEDGAMWNNPDDIAKISRAFTDWTDAVIAKDRAKVETFHDDGFRAGLGDKLLSKKQHIDVEMGIDNKEMRLLKIEATRRVGDILMVWSTHFIRADKIPEFPDLGLFGDWANLKMATKGFTQREISVWKLEHGGLKCLSFAATPVIEKN